MWDFECQTREVPSRQEGAGHRGRTGDLVCLPLGSSSWLSWALATRPGREAPNRHRSRSSGLRTHRLSCAGGWDLRCAGLPPVGCRPSQLQYPEDTPLSEHLPHPHPGPGPGPHAVLDCPRGLGARPHSASGVSSTPWRQAVGLGPVRTEDSSETKTLCDLSTVMLLHGVTSPTQGTRDAVWSHV